MSDDSYTPFDKRQPPQPPRLELLETCWRAVGVTGKVLECGIFIDDAPGFDVRAGYGPLDPMRTHRVYSVADGRVLAEQWRAAVVAKGFTALPLESPSVS